MSYQAFLLITSQLATRRKVSACIDDEWIFVEKTPKDHWTLSLKICDGNPIHTDLLRWQSGGAYLKQDPRTDALFLVQEMQIPQGKYIPFKNHLTQFLHTAEEWRQTLLLIRSN